MATAGTLGHAELRDALAAIARVVADHAPALDRLEGEDGTAGGDLSAALGAAAEAAGDAAASLGLSGVLDAAAEGAAARADHAAGRGVAVVLGGLAESARNADRLDAERFALGLELAAERLAPADDGSHAGCLPAVVAVSAGAALGALDAGADLADMVIAAADDGLAELESGPQSNPALVERGVVDAAAAGFLLVLDVLASVLTGDPLPAPPLDPIEVPGGDGPRPGSYRVSCSVEPAEGCGLESASWLESVWFELGELERFDHSSARWGVSLVTSDPGRAIEALCDVGRPRDLRVVAVRAGA
jgi:hypothetical protein